jgi:hypothetical protein
MKHINLKDSVVMKELVKIGLEKGFIKPREQIKQASSQKNEINSNSPAIEQALLLADKLRNKGYIKDAEALEYKILLYKTAESTHLYRAIDEDGEDIINFAHEGDVKVAPAKDGLGDVETILSQHKKMVDIALKEKKANLINDLSIILNKTAQEQDKLSEGIEELNAAATNLKSLLDKWNHNSYRPVFKLDGNSINLDLYRVGDKICLTYLAGYEANTVNPREWYGLFESFATKKLLKQTIDKFISTGNSEVFIQLVEHANKNLQSLFDRVFAIGFNIQIPQNASSEEILSKKKLWQDFINHDFWGISIVSSFWDETNKFAPQYSERITNAFNDLEKIIRNGEFNIDQEVLKLIQRNLDSAAQIAKSKESSDFNNFANILDNYARIFGSSINKEWKNIYNQLKTVHPDAGKKTTINEWIDYSNKILGDIRKTSSIKLAQEIPTSQKATPAQTQVIKEQPKPSVKPNSSNTRKLTLEQWRKTIADFATRNPIEYNAVQSMQQAIVKFSSLIVPNKALFGLNDTDAANFANILSNTGKRTEFYSQKLEALDGMWGRQTSNAIKTLKDLLLKSTDENLKKLASELVVDNNFSYTSKSDKDQKIVAEKAISNISKVNTVLQKLGTEGISSGSTQNVYELIPENSNPQIFQQGYNDFKEGTIAINHGDLISFSTLNNWLVKNKIITGNKLSVGNWYSLLLNLKQRAQNTLVKNYIADINSLIRNWGDFIVQVMPDMDPTVLNATLVSGSNVDSYTNTQQQNPQEQGAAHIPAKPTSVPSISSTTSSEGTETRKITDKETGLAGSDKIVVPIQARLYLQQIANEYNVPALEKVLNSNQIPAIINITNARSYLDKPVESFDMPSEQEALRILRDWVHINVNTVNFPDINDPTKLAPLRSQFSINHPVVKLFIQQYNIATQIAAVEQLISALYTVHKEFVEKISEQKLEPSYVDIDENNLMQWTRVLNRVLSNLRDKFRKLRSVSIKDIYYV